MDKETLSNYGWIVVILVLGLCIILMAGPLGNYINSNLKFNTINQVKTIKQQETYTNPTQSNSQRSITYDLDGGSWDGGYIKKYTIGKETTLPTNIKKQNYIFSGWLYNGSVIDTIDSAQTSSISLKAKWVGEQFSISYNLNGGNLPCSITERTQYGNQPPFYYRYGKDMPLNDIIVLRDGYSFVGWYTDPSFSKPITLISKTTTGNLTLYAKWVKN